MKKQRFQLYLWVVVLPILTLACDRFLDAKPDQSLAVPSTTKDLWAIIDNNIIFNQRDLSSSEVLSDNYFLTSTTWSGISSALHRSLYIWEKNDDSNRDWVNGYVAIYYANTVLEHLGKIELSNPDEKNELEGAAHFLRGYYLFSLAQLFVPPITPQTRSLNLGLPLRYNTDVEEKSIRSTVAETYDAILHDLTIAAKLLTANDLDVKTRPSKPAALGMLGKVHLVIHQYDSAEKYAQEALQLYDELMDFNKDIDPSSTAPFQRFNKEVMFHSRSAGQAILNPGRAFVDSVLIDSYANNDLRKTAYFRYNSGNTYSFKGNYDGVGASSGFMFGGVTTNEVFLILAEAQARRGKVTESMITLNTLLINRYASPYSPFSAQDPDEALSHVLSERRKELLFRGTRWSDLRRLKDEVEYSTTPKRLINNISYELPPESDRYTIAIPYDQVIKLSGVEQNP